MKKTVYLLTALAAAYFLGSFTNGLVSEQDSKEEAVINPGAFSMSLSVKDLKTSKEFYENLGFRQSGGKMEQNYVIMKNGNTLIGLFQGMFEGNMLTFNPGWDQNAKALKKYNDVREIQKVLKSKGVKISPEVDEATKGPGFIMFSDPDGNMILLDQHR